MPWQHCGVDNNDDQECAACGMTKAAWTVEWDNTRTFTVSRATQQAQVFKLRLIDADDEEVSEEPYELEFPNGKKLTGTLDDFGYAKVPSDQDGDCKVVFPRRPPDTWERVPTSMDQVGVQTYRTWDYAVVLDLDDDPTSMPHVRYRLLGDHGYDRTKTLKDNRRRSGGVEILFGVDSPDATYSCHVDPDGKGTETYALFEHVPYRELELRDADLQALEPHPLDTEAVDLSDADTPFTPGEDTPPEVSHEDLEAMGGAA